jgi:hypothetical protein
MISGSRQTAEERVFQVNFGWPQRRGDFASAAYQCGDRQNVLLLPQKLIVCVGQPLGPDNEEQFGNVQLEIAAASP